MLLTRHLVEVSLPHVAYVRWFSWNFSFILVQAGALSLLKLATPLRQCVLYTSSLEPPPLVCPVWSLCPRLTVPSLFPFPFLQSHLFSNSVCLFDAFKSPQVGSRLSSPLVASWNERVIFYHLVSPCVSIQSCPPLAGLEVWFGLGSSQSSVNFCQGWPVITVDQRTMLDQTSEAFSWMVIAF